MSAAHVASTGESVSGIRIGNDSVWVKPPASRASHVSYHRDSMYIPFTPSLTGTYGKKIMSMWKICHVMYLDADDWI